MAKKTAKKAAKKVAAKKPVAKKPALKKPAAKMKTAKPVKAAAKKATKPAMKPAAKAAPTAAVKVTAQPRVASRGMTHFNPLDDRIVIERIVAPEKTAGGLYIPDSAQEKPTLGKVVAVGRGHRDAKGRTRPCDVKVGDKVLFTAWSGSEIEVEGATYVIMRETDLLGVTNA